ncbi:MAG: UbiD family decarboxylase [Ardenticatenia bacterium]|nr:UbiD family decarboxylase [Ardenticatenia bacterium]
MDLRAFLNTLGEALLRVPQELSPQHEMAAFLRAVEEKGLTVLFEHVAGYPNARVAGNVLVTRRHLALALSTDEAHLEATYVERKGQARPTVTLPPEEAPVKEEVIVAGGPWLPALPVLTHYERDAGPFITAGVVFARDPETGRRGFGIHRMMIKGERRLGIFLANPPLATYYARAEARGEPLPVAVALGVHPALLVGAVVPDNPAGPDKLEVTGALMGTPLELVPAETVPVEVPARAEIVIEGHVLPGHREPEGPMGENTGYYFTNTSPVMEVTAITRRRDFIYLALCPWGADVDVLFALAGGTELRSRLQALVPEVVDVTVNPGTPGFSAVIAVRPCSPARVRRLIGLALHVDRRLKVVTVVNDDVDIRNPREVTWALATRFQPDRDTVIVPGLEGYVIDPSVGRTGTTAKVGFDATRGPGPEFDKIALPATAVAKAQAILSSLLGS